MNVYNRFVLESGIFDRLLSVTILNYNQNSILQQLLFRSLSHRRICDKNGPSKHRSHFSWRKHQSILSVIVYEIVPTLCRSVSVHTRHRHGHRDRIINSVKGVCLGFPSQSFFGKYFKKVTGLSPSEFRERGAGVWFPSFGGTELVKQRTIFRNFGHPVFPACNGSRKKEV